MIPGMGDTNMTTDNPDRGDPDIPPDATANSDPHRAVRADGGDWNSEPTTGDDGWGADGTTDDGEDDQHADSEWETEGQTTDRGWVADGPNEGQPPSSPVGTRSSPNKGPDEQFCSSCGGVINRQATICPQCGVTTRNTTTKTQQEPMGRLAAALIGGIVGFVISFVLGLIVSFLSVFVALPTGGAIAGYLRGANTKESAITGGLSGVIASIPTLVLYGVILLFFGALGVAEGPEAFEGVAGVAIIGVVLFVVGLVLNIGLGALGGAIGAAVSDRQDPEL